MTIERLTQMIFICQAILGCLLNVVERFNL